MRTRTLVAAIGLLLIVTVLVVANPLSVPIGQPSATPTARPAVPTDASLRALDCTAPVALPEKIDRIANVSRRPDESMIAVARYLDPRAFSRTLIRPPIDPSSVRIQLVDPRTLTVVNDIGSGIRPLWSGSGRYLSYHSPQGGGLQVPTDFVVFDTSVHREVARLRTTDIVNASAAWDGDALIYLDGADVHRWEATGDRIMSTISAAYLPPEGLPVISADGRAFGNAIGSDGAAPVNAFVIDAATGRATTLTGVRSVEWSRTGHRLLARYDDRRELIDEDGTVHRADVSFEGTVVQWSPDGRQPLFHEPPSPLAPYPATLSFTDFNGRPTGITISSAVSGSFDRDGRRFIGRWFDGYFPPELRVYTCTPA